MWMGGLQYAPIKDFWIQGAYYVSNDVIRIGYLDTDYVMRLADKSYLRLAAQYTDQRSDGSNALTRAVVLDQERAGLCRVRQRVADLLRRLFAHPLGRRHPPAVQQRPDLHPPGDAHLRARARTAWQLGIGVDFGTWAPGLSGWLDVTSGKDAINPTSGAKLADEIEYDIGAVYTLKQKGSFLDGLRARIRYGWVTDQTSVGDKHSTDLRIDINLPINLL